MGTQESYFDGGLLQLIGWNLLGAIITFLTFGICYPWALCMVYGWEIKHTVVDVYKRQLYFSTRDFTDSIMAGVTLSTPSFCSDCDVHVPVFSPAGFSASCFPDVFALPFAPLLDVCPFPAVLSWLSASFTSSMQNRPFRAYFLA